MATLRWEDPIHYYDYTPETVQRHHDRDVFTVAEAYIYNPDSTASLHLVYVITGLELHKPSMTMARAIDEARRHLEQLTRRDIPGTPFEQVKTLQQNKVLVFSWDGRPLGHVL